jgi:hypothetical protein
MSDEPEPRASHKRVLPPDSAGRPAAEDRRAEAPDAGAEDVEDGRRRRRRRSGRGRRSGPEKAS